MMKIHRQLDQHSIAGDKSSSRWGDLRMPISHIPPANSWSPVFMSFGRLTVSGLTPSVDVVDVVGRGGW